MSSNHASTSSPAFDSLSNVEGFIFLNSPSRWYNSFLFLEYGVFYSSPLVWVLLEDLSFDLDSLFDFSNDGLLVSLFTYDLFDLLFSSIFCNNISFNSCFSSCFFLTFSLYSLKVLSPTTIRLLIVFITLEDKLFSLFCSGFCWLKFPRGLIYSSFCVDIL